MAIADQPIADRTSSAGRWALASGRSIVFLVDGGGLERRLTRDEVEAEILLHDLANASFQADSNASP